MLPEGFSIDQMRADEVPVLTGWAAAEGWNPGDGDVAIAWDLDPDAFLALRHGDDLVGGGTILSYDGAFGFMGMFIVRPDHRGAGLGTELWFTRRDRLRGRLAPGAPIGMDGVFDMVPFYARGGFEVAHRDLRFEGPASGAVERSVVTLDVIDRALLDEYDQRHVAAPRFAFLSRWIDRPGVGTAAVVEDGRVVGYGVRRPAAAGHRIGPLFADRPDVAERILAALGAGVAGEIVQIDVPEVNAEGLDLAARFGLTESFGCARMYLGRTPALPVDEIYGVTSLEFG